jgi:tripartite-type tricarboxylate transporter receptor subunit TctC
LVPAPGGSADIMTRLIGQWLSERLGQPMIIENRPGAGTNLAVQAVVNAPPDGYTLLSLTSSNAANVTLYENLPFDVRRDIVPIASIIRNALVLAVNPSLPFTSVADFIAHAKANPGKLSVASFGVGSTSHLAQELFCAMAGITVIHVPYRGDAPALTDAISGQRAFAS